MKDAYLVPGEQIPERYRRLYAEINLDAVRENLGRMKENLAPDTSIIAVVKADAYGHGAEVVARELEEASYVSGFAVATFEEAVSLRRAGIVKPVLVLGYVFPCCYGEAIRQDIRLALFREDTLKELQKAAGLLKARGILKKPKVPLCAQC